MGPPSCMTRQETCATVHMTGNAIGLWSQTYSDSEEKNEGRVLQIVETHADTAASDLVTSGLECVAGKMLRKRLSTMLRHRTKLPGLINRVTYQAGRTHPKSDKTSKCARDDWCNSVHVTQTDGLCQHSCLRSDNRFRFVAVSHVRKQILSEIPCQCLPTACC